LAAPLIESTRLDFEKRLAQKDLDVAGREKSIQEREAALSKEKDALETQVNERMQKERGKIAADEAKKAKLALSNDIEQKTKEVADLQEILKQKDEKLTEAQKAQADLIKKQRELDDAKRVHDLDRHALLADAEILPAAFGLRTPVAIGGDVDRAETVGLATGGFGSRLYC